tara:strand:- start:9757 stop:10596 length:840 start_codon:yes stop_codon:yes gene_type:complete
MATSIKPTKTIKISKTTKQTAQPSFDTALATYYKLQGDYNAINNRNVTKIVKDKDLSLTQKQEKYDQLKKKCINCGKSGGTIFEQVNNKLTAKCGNQEAPCKLDIQLIRANYTLLPKTLLSQEATLNSNKSSIIITKLNYLFGLISEEKTLTNFTSFKSQLVDLVKQYQDSSEKYLSIINNNNPEIKRITDILLLEIINLKQHIKDYNETGQEQFIKDAVQIYINQIVKLNKELNKLKYALQYTYVSQDTTYLIQKEYKLSDLETKIPNTENKIISFIT